MLATNGRMKIALQKSGRLSNDSFELLRSCGLEFDLGSRALHTPCRNLDVDLLALRDDDIPEYVQDGVADLGIVGRNLVIETGARVCTLMELGFSACRLMICVPEHSRFTTVHDLNGSRIATSYPTALGEFLEREGISCEIVRLSGAVELAPALDVADAICDLVSTGSTARVNGLRLLHTVLESQALLVANREAMEKPAKRELIDRLLIRIRGSLQARGRRYVMLNAPRAALPDLQRVLPSLRSLTIVPLADNDFVAVHSVIAEDAFWDVMEALKGAGATDIVVTPIEAVIA